MTKMAASAGHVDKIKYEHAIPSLFSCSIPRITQVQSPTILCRIYDTFNLQRDGKIIDPGNSSSAKSGTVEVSISYWLY